jgi:hypothetical protein
MVPNLARVFEISYKTTTGAMIRIAAKPVAITETALMIFLELYSTESD